MWPTGSPTDDELSPRCRQRCRQQNHPTARRAVGGKAGHAGSGIAQ
jgi:hypothetical protein